MRAGEFYTTIKDGLYDRLRPRSPLRKNAWERLLTESPTVLLHSTVRKRRTDSSGNIPLESDGNLVHVRRATSRRRSRDRIRAYLHLTTNGRAVANFAARVIGTNEFLCQGHGDPQCPVSALPDLPRKCTHTIGIIARLVMILTCLSSRRPLTMMQVPCVPRPKGSPAASASRRTQRASGCSWAPRLRVVPYAKIGPPPRTSNSRTTTSA